MAQQKPNSGKVDGFLDLFKIKNLKQSPIPGFPAMESPGGVLKVQNKTNLSLRPNQLHFHSPIRDRVGIMRFC